MSEIDPFASSGGGVKLSNGAWVPKTHSLASSPAAPTSPTAAPTAPTAPAAGPTTAKEALTSAPPATPTTAAGAFQTALLGKLTAPPPTAQSAELQPALAANRLSEQRGFERDRAMLAERSAAQGFDNGGGFETGLLGLAQNRAQREGAFEGQAVADLGRRQAAELMAALSLTGGMLGESDRLALQDKLGSGQLDLQRLLGLGGLENQRLGITTQGALGRDELGLRRELGLGQLDLGRAGLGLQAGLGQANLNQQGLLALLQGL